MRLWSIHPGYLDSKGLLAVWREGLLAQKVLSGKTKGYRNHPQLQRFRKCRFPLVAIRIYLLGIYQEAKLRGYAFDRLRINLSRGVLAKRIAVTKGQVAFEFEHLLTKLKIRDFSRYKKLRKLKKVILHPVFRKVTGRREEWERGGRRGSLCAR
ncbi:MAG: pyrimidine dimer DNA glycosylase/endonuclease V [Candidatus Omnitrophica bacterium]|jgi:hypothetical protein|nr:pyrimidine dimer DNA glycosylase/endonuclease V [Candidatus Omnitrophota bacterium]